MYKDQIIKAIKTAVGVEKVEIEFPENEAFGDYSSNVAMQLFARVKVQESGRVEEKGKATQQSNNEAMKQWSNPRELAEAIVNQLKTDKELTKVVDHIEVAGSPRRSQTEAGPAFINFWLKKEMLLDTLLTINSQKDIFGRSEEGKGKTVIVDYSAPNIAKPFGIGHLRSTIIGQTLYNLYQFLGYKVVGDNHLGDWGTQFGKLIYMIKKENVIDFDIDKLEELYVEFHQLAEDPTKVEEMEAGARDLFKKLENGDGEAKQIWQKCVDISLSEFNRIYKLLGVKIDCAHGESFYGEEMKKMENDKEIRKHLIRGEDGAWIIDLIDNGIKTPLMFLKKDGTTTYATRDLATVKFRMEKSDWQPVVKMIYEVGAEQTLHFQQVFAAARVLGLIDDKVELYHTKHGLYLAPDGKKFSTREGKTVKLEEVLNEAIKRARALSKDRKVGKEVELEEISRKVGIGAVKYFDLMHGIKNDVVFDWEKMINLEGNSGPYLQYTYARTQSVLAKSKRVEDLPAGKAGRESRSEKDTSNGGRSSLRESDSFEVDQIEFCNETMNQPASPKTSSQGGFNTEELAVLRVLPRFPEIIAIAAKTYSPNLLCNYLYDLASKFNNFYNKHRILSRGEIHPSGGVAPAAHPTGEKATTDSSEVDQIEQFRLALTAATGQILKTGLNLLGIETPNKM